LLFKITHFDRGDMLVVPTYIGSINGLTDIGFEDSDKSLKPFGM